MYIAALAATTLSFASTLSIADEVKVVKDEENVVSSRLEGSWEVDEALTKRLTGKKEVKGEHDVSEVTFEADDEVFAKLPEKFKGFMEKEKTPVYMCGWMSAGPIRGPFFLVELRGNPHVLFFLEADGDPFGNPESFNVMLAVGKEQSQDLLFIGGDFNNQPFAAFGRAKE